MKVNIKEATPEDGFHCIYTIVPESDAEKADFSFRFPARETFLEFLSLPSSEVPLKKLLSREDRVFLAKPFDSIAFESWFDGVIVRFGGVGQIHLKGKLLKDFVVTMNEASEKLTDGIHWKKNRIDLKIPRKKSDISWAIEALKKGLKDIDSKK